MTVPTRETGHLAASVMPDSVSAYARAAKAQLPPDIWAYLMDGDSVSETSFASGSVASVHSNDNVEALRQCTLVPRPLRYVAGGHTSCTLFGQHYAHPMLLAPVAYQRLFHAGGELASAWAAAAQGAPMVISSLSSQPLAGVASAARSEHAAGAWFQLYWQGNRDATKRLLQRAESACCSAIVFTIDAPVKQAQFALPEDISAVNLEPSENPVPSAAMTYSGASTSAVFDGWMAQAPTWADLDWLRQQTTLPLLVKGIVHPDDADMAIAAGCDGVVVSDHGGRVLRGTPASLHALKAVATRVQRRIPVLFDSGIRSGRDVQVAIALGASAVLIGRPAIWGLAAKGPLGVAHVLRLLRDELEMTMALTGCRTLADIGPDCLGFEH